MNFLKFSIILINCLIFSFSILAQNTIGKPKTITWYEEHKKKIINKREIIHVDDKNVYCTLIKDKTYIKKSNIYLEKYATDNMKLVKAKLLNLKYQSKRLTFGDIFKVKEDNMYLLASYFNKKKKKHFLFYRRINPYSLEIDEQLTKISEIPDNWQYSNSTAFKGISSPDTSKILLYSNLSTAKKEAERFNLQVFDHKFAPIWSKEVSLPYKKKNFSIEKYHIDDEGNAYLLGIIYSGNKSRLRRKGEPTYQYVIFTYRNKGESVEEYKVNLDNKFITDLTFRITEDNNLIFAGFYSEKNAFSIKGTYFFKLNPRTKKIEHQNFKEFDFKLRSEDLSGLKQRMALKADQKGNNKKEAELYQYELDEMILRTDGGSILIAEQFSGNKNVKLGQSVNEKVYYNDIIIANINPDGEIAWTTRIPKKQESHVLGIQFSSYEVAVGEEKLYFIYNDNRKNHEGKDRKVKKFKVGSKTKNSVIVLAAVDRDGKVITHPIKNSNKGFIKPKFCEQISRKEMLIYYTEGRKFKFGKLIFE